MRLYYLVFVDPYNKVCVLQSTSNMMYVMRRQLTPDQIEEVFRKLSLIFEFAVQRATAESVHADYKFLDDQKTYLRNQLEYEFGGDRCFGILADMDFILVCTYEKDGENPELVIYKKR